MSRIISKKRALLTAAIASLALVAVAVAFYSTTGSGSNQGAGTTDDNYANQLAITSTGDASNLVPGEDIVISGTITNNNPGSAAHGTPVPTLETSDVDCDLSANFAFLNDLTYTSGASNVIAAGGNRTFTVTLAMKDLAVSQDNCKGAPLAIDWSSN